MSRTNHYVLNNEEKLNKVLKNRTKLIRKLTRERVKYLVLFNLHKITLRKVVGKDVLNHTEYSCRRMLDLYSGSSRTSHVWGQECGKAQVQSGEELDI